MEEKMYNGKALRILMSLMLLTLNLITIGPAAEATSKPQQRPVTKMKDNDTHETPFVCNVAALNAEQRQRYMTLIKKLKSTNQEVRELADGYAFRFPAESATVQELAEFIIYERLCCPFFDFELAIEREGGPAWLRLRGREGVKDFIRLEFGIQ